MSFGRISRGMAIASLAVASWTVDSILASADDSKPRKETTKERASGVILKVERVASKDSRPEKFQPVTRRLTINTNDVWRDWARDQSQKKDQGSAAKDAKKGSDSVATVGEPADSNSLVIVDVGPETRVETRFRAPDDETSAGSKASETTKNDDKDSSKSKVVHFRAEDLKPGLFVEVNFRPAKPAHSATVLSVIRPIGGPDSGSADDPK